LSFDAWLSNKIKGVKKQQLNQLGKNWLIAVVECFGQKRTDIAPINEPCDEWLSGLKMIIKNYT
jgi:hypothetical protein